MTGCRSGRQIEGTSRRLRYVTMDQSGAGVTGYRSTPWREWRSSDLKIKRIDTCGNSKSRGCSLSFSNPAVKGRSPLNGSTLSVAHVLKCGGSLLVCRHNNSWGLGSSFWSPTTLKGIGPTRIGPIPDLKGRESYIAPSATRFLLGARRSSLITRDRSDNDICAITTPAQSLRVRTFVARSIATLRGFSRASRYATVMTSPPDSFSCLSASRARLAPQPLLCILTHIPGAQLPQWHVWCAGPGPVQ